MKMVIDIPEDAYRQIRNWGVPTDELRRKIYDIIDNGTPLPEHHGRLIDADVLIDEMPIDICDGYEAIDEIERTPTIIEGSDRDES